MKKQFFVFLLIISSLFAKAQSQYGLKGMYVQWGYNREWYSRSNIHFKMANGNDFTVYNATAADKSDFAAIAESPIDITIPQYNIRIGFYLNQSHSHSLEINFDHAKYIVTDGQNLLVQGTIDGKAINEMQLLMPETFLHFEHTDGANWLHLNYVRQLPLVENKTKNRSLLTAVGKIEGGINIPKTDFTWRGDRLNNQFHVAGYNFSVEAGLRYYPTKKLFLEGTAKTGFVNYLNALTNTATTTGNRANHHFTYFEAIVTLGYDIGF
jgi:hypothetical protein